MPNETHPIYDLLLPIIQKGSDTMQQLKSLVEYFAFVIIEGDWLNDSLTELDPSVVEWVKTLGQAVAILFGN